MFMNPVRYILPKINLQTILKCWSQCCKPVADTIGIVSDSVDPDVPMSPFARPYAVQYMGVLVLGVGSRIARDRVEASIL
jgi:hypothetical protein